MRLERLPWDGTGRPEAGALRRMLESEGFSVWSWTDAPGASYSPHHHDHDECIWLVDGQITFGAGGAEYPLHPGDRLMLPRATVHTAVVGPAGATYLVGER